MADWSLIPIVFTPGSTLHTITAFLVDHFNLNANLQYTTIMATGSPYIGLNASTMFLVDHFNLNANLQYTTIMTTPSNYLGYVTSNPITPITPSSYQVWG